MGIYITFKIRDAELRDKLDLDETASLEKQVEQDSEAIAAYRLVFGEDVDGVTRNVACSEVLRAIDILIERSRGKVTSYTYCVVVPEGYPMSGASSGVSGLRVGDASCGILGGFDQCTLITFKQNAQGEWVKTAEEDARELGSLKTDNCGVVRIRKRGVPGGLLKLLKRIRARLAPLDPMMLVGITVG